MNATGISDKITEIPKLIEALKEINNHMPLGKISCGIVASLFIIPLQLGSSVGLPQTIVCIVIWLTIGIFVKFANEFFLIIFKVKSDKQLFGMGVFNFMGCLETGIVILVIAYLRGGAIW